MQLMLSSFSKKEKGLKKLQAVYGSDKELKEEVLNLFGVQVEHLKQHFAAD